VKRSCRRAVSNSVDHFVFVLDEDVLVAEGIVREKKESLVAEMHVKQQFCIIFPVLLSCHVQRMSGYRKIVDSVVPCQKKISCPYRLLPA
jgi:hypothetical protein